MTIPFAEGGQPGAQALARGREAARLQAWGDAFLALSTADKAGPIDPQDLQLLSIAAHLTGREVESAELLARAHQGFLSKGETRQAARCASWLSFISLLNGDTAQSGGWLSRSRRLLEGEEECLEQGYLLYAEGFRSARSEDGDGAMNAFRQSASIATRFGDKDLATMALQGQGRVLIRMGQKDRGVQLLDEAMVAIQAGEISPMIAGGVYCSVIEACSEILDLRRAQEWTLALERWCASQPEVVPYRGHCLIRRAEILQMHGDWPGALDEAQSACERLSQPSPKPPIGGAFYRKADVHRLRGEFAQAESAYREASRWERGPRPGLAQLWLAQGKVQAAYTAIQQLLDEAREPGKRAFLLDAAVEIALAAEDISHAAEYGKELSLIASKIDAPYLHSLSERASGAVSLARADAREAGAALRRALNGFRDLEAPYEEARCRVLLSQACLALGNPDQAGMELTAACEIFRKLGAAPDLARAESRRLAKAPSQTSLTGRELEVLRLVASGMTNRTIATSLHISEKTVARHISNIFTKLDLPSRAAATAYAYQRGLAGPST